MPAFWQPSRGATLVIAASFCSCASVDDRPSSDVDFSAVTLVEFPALSANPGAHGIDVASKKPSAADWRPDNELIYGLRATSGTDARRWLLRFRALTRPGARKPINMRGFTTDEPELFAAMRSRQARIEITLSSAGGKVLTTSTRRVFCDLFQRGMHASIAVQERVSKGLSITAEDRQTKTEGFLGFLFVFRAISNNGTLRDILLSVADKPSLFSIMTHLGLSLSIDLSSSEARPTTTMVGDSRLPAYELPFSIMANGSPVLHGWITLVEPRAPLHLGAGIVGIDAYRPSDRETTLSLRLLAGSD